MWCITKWCASITDSGKDEYTHKVPALKEKLMEKYGTIPKLYDFRLLDGDGVIYAYGKGTDDSSFAPLDYYMYDYGCTEIQWKNPQTKTYETL